MSRLYHREMMEHFKNSVHRGKVLTPTHGATDANPSCGDKLSLTMIIVDGVIKDIKFDGDGCVVSQAAASLMIGKLKGQPVSMLDAMSEDEVIALLKIPIGVTRRRCATLALSVARKAIAGQ